MLEIIHTHVCSPFTIEGNINEKYLISFINDYSKIARVYRVRIKYLICMGEFVNESDNIIRKKVKTVRCVNGREFCNNKFFRFAKAKSIWINNCSLFVHKLNGTVERFNKTIMDMTRCLLDKA